MATSTPATSEPHREWTQKKSDPTGEIYPQAGGASFILSQAASAADGSPIITPASFPPSSISQKASIETKRGKKASSESVTSVGG
jgi:hypothetical protein